MEKKKNAKLIALIIAIVVVVLGTSAGVMYAFGVFKSDKARAFELLKQAPQKIGQSASGEYIGAQDMTEAMLERGVDFSMKYSNMQMDGVQPKQVTDILAKLQFELGMQMDFKNHKGRINLGAGQNGNDVSLQTYASLDDKKVCFAAPELLANKVFTLEAKEESSEQKIQKVQDFLKQLPELKDDFEDYIEEQGDAVYKGITCEKTEGGYRLTIPRDVTNDALQSLSDFTVNQKDCLGMLEELCGVQKGSLNASLNKILPQLKEGTADLTFDVLGEQGKLTGLKVTIKDKSGVAVACDVAFAGEKEQSSMNLTISITNNGQAYAKVEMKRTSEMGTHCKDAISFQVTGENEEVLMDSQTTMEIDTATKAVVVTANSAVEDDKSEMTAKGSIKNLEKGKCVTYQFDEMKTKTESLMGTQEVSFAAELTEGVLDGDIAAPQGEEVAINKELIKNFAAKYGQELMLSYFTILNKWGIDMNFMKGM